MKKICRNCRLFNEKEKVCGVTVLIEGESYELPVKPNDPCHWDTIDQDIQYELQTEIAHRPEPKFRSKLEPELDIPIEIKQVRMWSDGKNGFIETSE